MIAKLLGLPQSSALIIVPAGEAPVLAAARMLRASEQKAKKTSGMRTLLRELTALRAVGKKT